MTKNMMINEIDRLVKDGYNPMGVVMELGPIWGLNRRERGEIFEEYCLAKEREAEILSEAEAEV